MSESTTIESRYLSVEEAARYAGLSDSTIRRLVRRGLLRAARPVPNRLIIDRLEIDRYLHECSAVSA